MRSLKKINCFFNLTDVLRGKGVSSTVYYNGTLRGILQNSGRSNRIASLQQVWLGIQIQARIFHSLVRTFDVKLVSSFFGLRASLINGAQNGIWKICQISFSKHSNSASDPSNQTSVWKISETVWLRALCFDAQTHQCQVYIQIEEGPGWRGP